MSLGAAVEAEAEGPIRGRSPIAWVALGLIRAYQLTLSRLVGSACRYYPSCSRYTYEAIERYGFFRGGLMGAKRIARCHPWADGGVDPVP